MATEDTPRKLSPEAELALLHYLKRWAVAAFAAVAAVSGLVGWAILSSSREAAVDAARKTIEAAQGQLSDIRNYQVQVLKTMAEAETRTADTIKAAKDAKATIAELQTLTAAEQATVVAAVNDIKARYQSFKENVASTKELEEAVKQVGTNYEKIAGAIVADKRFFDRMEQRVSPIGTLVPFFGNSADIPPGFELCDGEPVKNAASPIVGLRKPNLRGRFLRGADPTASSVGDLKQGGSANVTLTVENLPKHAHSLPFKKVRDEIERADNYNRIYLGTVGGGEGGNFVSDAETDSEGKGAPFRLEPLYQDVYWIIRVL